MDRKTLEYMETRVNQAKVIKKRIDHLDKLKKFLLESPNGKLSAEITNACGHTYHLTSEASSSYVYEHYRETLLQGIENELIQLQKEFEEM